MASCSPSAFNRQLCPVNRKNPNFYQCFYFLLVSPGWGGGGEEDETNSQKTSQRTGKYFQVIFCFIPDLSLSVIQECQGTPPNTGSLLLWKHSLTSPSAGGSIWSLLLLPAALSSVGPAGSLGHCSAAAPPQPGSSPTRLAQVFQTCSSVQNGICHSALFVQGCVVNGK